ncbi:MAG: metallopeptidase TldD-related protein [Patescibacteria group bacterium]|nr:metallopeptidase TldD-related protein [Patescibacteria group bacterium]
MLKVQKKKNLVNSLNSIAKNNNVYLITRWQEKRVKRVTAVDDTIENVSTGRSSGVGFHLFNQAGRSVLTATDNTEDEKKLIETLSQGIKSLKKLGKKATPNKEIFLLEPKQDTINLTKGFDFNFLTVSQIEKKLLDLNKKTKELGKNPGVGESLRITTSFNIAQEGWKITRSDGTNVEWEIPRAYLGMHITYQEGKKKVNDSVIKSSPGWGVLTEPKLENNLLEEAYFVINMLKKSAKHPEYESGNYNLLIDAALGGLLAHEAFGHCAESDTIYEDGSVLSKRGKLEKGKKVANPTLSIVDETKEKTWSFQPYSAFGVPRGKIDIIKNGCVKESLGDVFTGKDIGDKIRGAARVESYSSTPLPRMSRTFISVKNPKSSPGYLADPKQIQKMLKDNGLLEEKILVLRGSRGGGQVDTQAGTFMFGFSYLYEITPTSINIFRGSSFSGKTLEALKSITEGFGPIKTDFPGMCGRGQRVTSLIGSNEFIYLEKSPYVTLGGT